MRARIYSWLRISLIRVRIRFSLSSSRNPKTRRKNVVAEQAPGDGFDETVSLLKKLESFILVFVSVYDSDIGFGCCGLYLG